MQAGTRDCGVFAIANALSIVNGEDPFKKMFDQKTMQRDLRSAELLTMGF